MTYTVAKTFGENIKLSTLELVPDYETRRELAAVHVTINEKPATISGLRHKFAVVRALDGSVSAEWSWDAVARIVSTGGKFIY